MGQRLNLEIWDNGKILANAYYHWSAYTSSASEIVNETMDYITNNVPDTNKILYAIRALEATGAGLTSNEVEHAKKLDYFSSEISAECNGRNAGLISISNDGIQSTRYWADENVYIFLDEKRISFKVYWNKRKWEFDKDQQEEDEELRADDLKVMDFNIDDIKFENWKEFYEFAKSYELPWISEVCPFEVFIPINNNGTIYRYARIKDYTERKERNIFHACE